jgi:hypothetical protein
MSEYKKYSRDIWDYIKDLPYMPSRADRERLFLDEEKRERVKLWDYFFRIKPKDVGKPQRVEISSIIKETRESVERCKQRELETIEKIKELERKALIKAITRLFWGIVVLGITLFFGSRIPVEMISTQEKNIYIVIFSFVVLVILIVIIGLNYLIGEEKKECKWLVASLKEYKEEHFKKINEAKRRLSALRKEVARLRRQIPIPLHGQDVRRWFDDELNELRDYTKTQVALVREIIEVQSDDIKAKVENPLLVSGPGELQQIIPRRFSIDVNRDLNKHLGAKQAYSIEKKSSSDLKDFPYDTLFDILYGVYFLEFIVIAEDMLVTHSFFYDFIEKKVVAEYTSEQYYEDVVALSIQKKTQEISTRDVYGRVISYFIEDSPTFTLSLKSGETHEVTFVSQNYFINVREKLNISLDNVDRILWINKAKTITENVIKSLRYYLRQHKVL